MKRQLPRRSIEGMASLIETYGKDFRQVAKQAGLNTAVLEQADATLDAVLFNELLEEAAMICNDRFFSIKYAKLTGWDVLGPIWPLVLSAPSVGEALQRLGDHLALHTHFITAFVKKDSTGASFCYEVKGVSAATDIIHRSRVQAIELGLALTCYELQKLLGCNWRPDLAQFRHCAPDDLAPMHKVFGDNLSFNQDINAIHLNSRDCKHPLQAITSVARRRIQSELKRDFPAGIPFPLQVDHLIRLLINNEGCSVEKVAEMLGIPARTMQYRLKQSQTSYQALYDIARLDLAKHYVSNSSLTIAAITERLYFTDTAAFSRFFKKHIGCSPQEYRQK